MDKLYKIYKYNNDDATKHTEYGPFDNLDVANGALAFFYYADALSEQHNVYTIVEIDSRAIKICADIVALNNRYTNMGV